MTVRRQAIPPARHRGLTLLETLMASGILLGVVTALTSAIVSVHQQSFEAQQRIAASMAADSMMNRVVAEPYSALPGWNNYTEGVGAMLDEFGDPMDPMFSRLGRRVRIFATARTFSEVNVRVRGRTVVVDVFDESGRELILIARFIAEPQP